MRFISWMPRRLDAWATQSWSFVLSEVVVEHLHRERKSPANQINERPSTANDQKELLLLYSRPVHLLFFSSQPLVPSPRSLLLMHYPPPVPTYLTTALPSHSLSRWYRLITRTPARPARPAPPCRRRHLRHLHAGRLIRCPPYLLRNLPVMTLGGQGGPVKSHTRVEERGEERGDEHFRLDLEHAFSREIYRLPTRVATEYTVGRILMID
jgi:hypothetical protein